MPNPLDSVHDYQEGRVLEDRHVSLLRVPSQSYEGYGEE